MPILNYRQNCLELLDSKMEDNDGSSNAAQSAPTKNTVKNFNLSEKFLRLFNRNKPENSVKTNDEAQESKVSTDSHGMFNLRRLCVEDVAIPKAEIVSVSADIKKSELVTVFRESGLTRLPVYEGTLDNPIGMVHLKDFTLKYAFARKNTLKIKDILRPLLYVPASMTIGILLTKMQSDRRHLALVIDEYGGVDGLVTIEDLIEPVLFPPASVIPKCNG